LAGKARHPPYEIKMLMETVKAAEGRSDFDRGMMEELEDQPAPGDVDIESPTGSNGPIFGIPEPDDPDPFGVLALEREGLEIREAGSKSRPESTQFEFNPSPTSPIYTKFNRRSLDTLGTKSNRESYISNRSSKYRTSTDRGTQTMEMGTQTDDRFSSPATSPSYSDENKRIVEEDELPIVIEPEDIDYTKIDLGPFSHLNRSQDFDGTTVNENDSPREHDSEHPSILVDSVDNSYATEDEFDEEEPVIFEAASAQATMITPQVIKARGGLVNIPKRPPPPPLPPRSLARASKVVMVDHASGQSPIRSPSKNEFEEVDLHGVERKSNEMPHGIVMEDLEKQDSKDSTATAVPKHSLEEKVEQALKEQHLDNITPSVEAPVTVLKSDDATQTGSKEMEPLSAGEATKTESNVIENAQAEKLTRVESPEIEKAIGAFPTDEMDEFHSIPTTPNEQMIEVK